MTLISELHNCLSNFLNWNKARINCLAQILRALLQVRTVNLTQIAAAFQSEVKEEFSYQRVCRFFRFLDPTVMEACFMEWTQSLVEKIKGIIAIE